MTLNRHAVVRLIASLLAVGGCYWAFVLAGWTLMFSRVIEAWPFPDWSAPLPGLLGLVRMDLTCKQSAAFRSGGVFLACRHGGEHWLRLGRQVRTYNLVVHFVVHGSRASILWLCVP